MVSNSKWSLPWPTEHVFGPKHSRRLGRSLAVDVIPRNFCTLDCVYCELGRTRFLTTTRDEYVSADRVVEEVRQFLLQGGEADHVTLSASGEPTLNTKLGEIIARLKDLTNIPIAILTNGTLLSDPAVRKDLMQADIVLPSLDAASVGVFRRINRPHGRLCLEDILAGLVQFRKEFRGKIWLEILFVKGFNDSDEEIRRLRRMAAKIGPDRIQLGTVVRLPAEHGVGALAQTKMEEIRERFGPACCIT